MRINRTFFRYFAYALEALIFYVLQGAPRLIPELFGSKPLLLIPVAITVAARENKIPSLVFGAVCGLLTDIGSGGVGFFAILLTVLCYFEAHIFESIFVPSFLTVMIFSLGASAGLIGLYFLIFAASSGAGEPGYLFVHHYISRIVYTFVMTIPFYFLNKFIYCALSERLR